MTYELFIGDRTFSSWSMRGWLMLECFDLPYKTTLVGLYSGTYREDLAALAPARTVPAMRTPQGGILTDSLAMAETLAEENPDLALYPKDPAARALARSMASEMHSGFSALRGACPQMLAHGWNGFAVSDDVKADLDRIMTLWQRAKDLYGADGPWLFGDYTLVDAFYAPVAGRIATYGLPVDGSTQSYVAAHLDDPAFRRWRAMGLTETYDPMPYRHALPEIPWPGPTPLTAEPVTDGTPENDRCPYSGEDVTHLAQIEGRIFGFCNAFCRDKTVADAAAWPKFMALLER
ncbi:glutathione S-transferase [Yoonia sp. R2331]|uniref:glutathione S-transferase n=1 Tax=Yoonia sp. R2331 TaxID=3237238 RepID=UPI0034E5D9A5